MQVGDSHKAYLLSDAQDHAANDEVGGERLVVLVRSDVPAGFAYLSSVEGRPLTFGLEGGALRDLETGSLWDDGRTVGGGRDGGGSAHTRPFPNELLLFDSGRAAGAGGLQPVGRR